MKHLLQYFTELSLHPKNAEELKGLILQLAIQGKLTAKWREENPDVEPASVLLERIQKEKARLVKEKKIRKEKPLPGITKEKTPFDLPLNWSWSRLGNLGFTQTGSTPPKKNPENYGDFIPFLGPADISNSWMRYPNEGLSERGIKIGRLIPKNSLMMVCIGGSIGKCNITEKDVSCNQQINTLTPIFCSPSYIKTICQSPNFQRSVLGKSTGSATPIINKGKWGCIIVPTAPLEEQKAIVKTVNQLFTEVEQLETLTKERIQLKEDFVTSALHHLHTGDTATEWAFLQQHFSTFFTGKRNIKKLRESILQLAVQGKLTHYWRKENPEVEPASVLLERIQEEKAKLIAAKKIRKEKPLPEITEEEMPYVLPEGWVWCRMGFISDIQRGSSPRPKGDPRYFSDTKTNNHWISIKDISRYTNNHFLFDTEEYLTDLGTQYSRYVNTNELIVAVSGSTTGKCCLTGIDGYIYDGLALIRLINNSIEPQYQLIYMLQLYNYMNNSKFGAAFPNINTKFLNEMLFPFPPFEEQKAIVDKVDELMSLCDQLEKAIQTSKATQEDWMKSSLREVFEREAETINS